VPRELGVRQFRFLRPCVKGAGETVTGLSFTPVVYGAQHCSTNFRFGFFKFVKMLSVAKTMEDEVRFLMGVLDS